MLKHSPRKVPRRVLRKVPTQDGGAEEGAEERVVGPLSCATSTEAGDLEHCFRRFPGVGFGTFLDDRQDRKDSLDFQEWTNHRIVKSGRFANFVREPGFKLNSPTFSREKPPNAGEKWVCCTWGH